MISIWFFIGMLLSVYGVLILGAGIYELELSRRRWSRPICTPPSGGACC